MPRPFPDLWLIDEPVTLVHPDGRRSSSAIRVGVPAQVGPPRPGANYESSCWAQVDHLVELGGPVIAFSTLAALTSAIDILAERILGFIAGGGAVLDAVGEDAALDTIFAPYRDAGSAP